MGVRISVSNKITIEEWNYGLLIRDKCIGYREKTTNILTVYNNEDTKNVCKDLETNVQH